MLRWIALFGLVSTAAMAKTLGGDFDLNQLPPGRNVTLPRAAAVIAPATGRIQIESTDLPQTLSVSTTSTNSGSLRLAIYDQSLDRVRYVNLRPGAPFLYAFKRLGSITIVPQKNAKQIKYSEGLALRIASDKPYSVGH